MSLRWATKKTMARLPSRTMSVSSAMRSTPWTAGASGKKPTALSAQVTFGDLDVAGAQAVAREQQVDPAVTAELDVPPQSGVAGELGIVPFSIASATTVLGRPVWMPTGMRPHR